MPVKQEDFEMIELKDVMVHFKVEEGTVRAVDHVNVRFADGEITGIIGESGCGKSVLAMSILGLLPSYAGTGGEIWLDGEDLLKLSPGQMRRIRGRKIGLIPQDPADSFNPVRKIRGQIKESLVISESRDDHSESTKRLLEYFGFSKEDSVRVMNSYPFELSGGMLQRAIAAMGTASAPEWIIADEPSKGLDEALRKQLYDTLAAVRDSGIKGMIIITHDLDLAYSLCDRLAVMYAGQIVEMGKGVLDDPKHPYTQGLIASLPENGMHPMAGSAPAPWDELTGCRFAPRCPFARQECYEFLPENYELSDRIVRCFNYA